MKTETKQTHTPGPWSISGGEIWSERHQVADMRSKIPRMLSGRQVEANARLIAAAPEMLEALNAALKYDAAIRRRAETGDYEPLNPRGAIATGADLDSLYDDWVSKAGAVIAKAEGK